ncbi:MAG: TlyA family RNA methyltransferase [Desulfatirhabdiaceae bacterium]
MKKITAMAASQNRLDRVLVDKCLVESRQKAQALILAGRVMVDNRRVDKPGTPVSDGAVIEIIGDDNPFVSRGGLKLEQAFQSFHIDADQKICMDVGASTGGFTDCLLQHGARRVYAVDVGYGQLAWKLRQDPRVVVIERTNIRYMSPETIPECVDLVVIDVSFISLKIVVPVVLKWMGSHSVLIALIKPQFEAGKGRVGKGGVIRDSRLHLEIIDDLTSFFQSIGLIASAVIPSPVLGPKGNAEFLIRLQPDN